MDLKGTHVCLTPPPPRSRGTLLLPLPPDPSAPPKNHRGALQTRVLFPNTLFCFPTAGRVTGAESAAQEEVRTPSGGALVRAGERVGGGPGPRCGAARGRAQGRSRRGG